MAATLDGYPVQALRAHHTRQAGERLSAGELWQEHDLVFCREDGTPLDRWHVRKELQKITKAARLGGEWTPRELRHSFVSILSAHDVRLEDISGLVGHSRRPSPRSCTVTSRAERGMSAISSRG